MMEGKIKENSGKMVTAFNGRDFDTIANLYTDDCQLMPAGLPLQHGSKAAGEFWKAAATDELYKMTLTTAEVWGPMQDATGAIGIERGKAVFHNKQGQLSAEAKYIAVWKEVGGDWKLFIDIFNMDK